MVSSISASPTHFEQQQLIETASVRTDGNNDLSKQDLNDFNEAIKLAKTLSPGEDGSVEVPEGSKLLLKMADTSGDDALSKEELDAFLALEEAGLYYEAHFSEIADPSGAGGSWDTAHINIEESNSFSDMELLVQHADLNGDQQLSKEELVEFSAVNEADSEMGNLVTFANSLIEDLEEVSGSDNLISTSELMAILSNNDASRPSSSSASGTQGSSHVASVNRAGSAVIGGENVSYSLQGGVLEDRGNSTIQTDVQDGQTQIVALGASDGGGSSLKDKPIDRGLMEEQGFTLMGVEGTKDKKVEIWARVYDSGNPEMSSGVTLSGNAKDVAFTVHTLDTALDIGGLDVKVDPASRSGDTFKFNTPSGDDFKFMAVFFDDSVEVLSDSDNIVQFWGQGDGDGFYVGLWGEGESVPNSVETKNHAKGGQQYESLYMGG